MPLEIFKEFRFEAAHFLPNVDENHKCRRLHGHSYRVCIFVEGDVHEPEGWVLDFADLKRAFKPILSELDHHNLNDVPGLENPTSEHLVKWIWKKLEPRLPGLGRLVLYETDTCGCVYTANPHARGKDGTSEVAVPRRANLDSQP